MYEVIAMLKANADSIFAVLFALHAFALVIVNLTPTPADNLVLAKVYKVVEFLAGFFTKKAKQ